MKINYESVTVDEIKPGDLFVDAGFLVLKISDKEGCLVGLVGSEHVDDKGYITFYDFTEEHWKNHFVMPIKALTAKM